MITTKHFPKYIKEIEKHDKYAKYNRPHEIPCINVDSGPGPMLRDILRLRDIADVIDVLIDSDFGSTETIKEKDEKK